MAQINLLDALLQLNQQQQPNNGFGQIMQGLQGFAAMENKPLEHLSKLAYARPDLYANAYGQAFANTADPLNDTKKRYYEAQIAQANDPFERLAKIQQLAISQQNADAITGKVLQDQQQRTAMKGLVSSLTGGGGITPPTSPDLNNLSAFTKAQLMAESGGNPNAVSPKGATGYMQLMPETASNPGFGITPVRDNSPQENIRVGQEYQNKLTEKYGDSLLGLMAYNWGPDNVDKWLSKGADPKDVPRETQNYVEKVLSKLPEGAVPGTGVVSVVQPQTNAMTLPNQPVQVPQGSTLADSSPKELPEGLKLLQNIAKETGDPSDARAFATALEGYEKDKAKASEIPGDPNLTGKEYLDSIPDKNIRNKAQALIEGRIPYPPQGRMSDTSLKAAVAAAQQADPSYSASTYQVRQKTQQMFAGGPEGRNVNAINTLVNHLGDWEKNVASLNNSGFVGINSLSNKALKQGDDTFNAKLNAANTAAGAVGSEAAKAYQGVGSISQEEREKWQSNLSTSLGPKARQATAKEIGQLLVGKIEALQNQYNSNIPLADKRFVTPKALKTLKNLGVDTSSIEQPGNFSESLNDTIPTVKNWVIKNGQLVQQ